MLGLEFVDFLQILAAALALATGLLSAFMTTKSNEKINRKGWVLVAAFFITAVIAIITTVAKAQSEFAQKEKDYKEREKRHSELIEKAETTLGDVRQVLGQSNEILKNTAESVQNLTDIQKISNNLNDSLSQVLQKSQILAAAQDQLLERNKQLLKPGGNSYIVADRQDG